MDWTEDVGDRDAPESFEGNAGRGKPRLALYVVVALLLVASIGGLGFYLGHDVVRPATSASPVVVRPNANFPSDDFGGFPRTTPSPAVGTVRPKVSAATAKIAKSVDPGLVDITTNLSYQSSTAEGTGMVLTSNGLVLTNNHVIQGATSITARDVATGVTYKATVVGYDVADDVALLQLQDASGLAKVKLGDSNAVTTDELVVGIGNAGGAGGTPSYVAGSVTALNQTITASNSGSPSGEEQLSGLIEVNAAVEPGDSGGPLVNAKGRVIGVDTAGSGGGEFAFGQFSSNLTRAYAIPINTALSIVKSIEKGQGTPTIHVGATGFLGIEIGPSLTGQSAGFGSGPATASGGVSVQATIPGTPAAQSALAAGDVITSLDGHAVSTAAALSDLVQRLHPGDTVQVGYLNQSGVQSTLSLKLASGPPL